MNVIEAMTTARVVKSDFKDIQEDKARDGEESLTLELTGEKQPERARVPEETGQLLNTIA